MSKTERIENAVRSIIEEVNVGRAPNQQVSADQSTLLAKGGGLLTRCPLLSSWNSGHWFLYQQNGDHA